MSASYWDNKHPPQKKKEDEETDCMSARNRMRKISLRDRKSGPFLHMRRPHSIHHRRAISNMATPSWAALFLLWKWNQQQQQQPPGKRSDKCTADAAAGGIYTYCRPLIIYVSLTLRNDGLQWSRCRQTNCHIDPRPRRELSVVYFQMKVLQTTFGSQCEREWKRDHSSRSPHRIKSARCGSTRATIVFLFLLFFGGLFQVSSNKNGKKYCWTRERNRLLLILAFSNF